MLKSLSLAAALAFAAVTGASANDAYSNAEYGIGSQYSGQWSHLDDVFAATNGAKPRHGFTAAEMRNFEDSYEAAEYGQWPLQAR